MRGVLTAVCLLAAALLGLVAAQAVSSAFTTSSPDATHSPSPSALGEGLG
jgi:Tfp pilus assembly protein PilV